LSLEWALLNYPAQSAEGEDYMLVITRKKGESILIGDDIEITVVKLDDNSVKLSISAPKDVTILRKELYKEVTEENKKSVVFDASILKDIRK
jgi:carbon storage regulator